MNEKVHLFLDEDEEGDPVVACGASLEDVPFLESTGMPFLVTCKACLSAVTKPLWKRAEFWLFIAIGVLVIIAGMVGASL